jgi:hypothetical protein
MKGKARLRIRSLFRSHLDKNSKPQQQKTQNTFFLSLELLTSENGIYLCLIMCLICLRIVTKNKAQK